MIELTDWLRAELARRRDQEAPEEACGLISRVAASPGLPEGGIELWAAENVAPDPTAGFEIAADNLLGILRQVEKRNGQLVGVYHSHPGGSIAPSPADVETATRWPGLTWIIVGAEKCAACEDGMACCGQVLDTGECCAALYGTDRLVPCSACGGEQEVPDFWVGVLA